MKSFPGGSVGHKDSGLPFRVTPGWEFAVKEAD